jgi:hypothetical protein
MKKMELKKYLIIAIISLVIINGINSAEAAKTITVSGSTTKDIQNAINKASSGDTVFIPAGMYKYTGVITVNTPNLLIQGAGVDYNNPASGTYLYTDLYGYNSKIMEINADNVRVTGIVFRGAKLPAYGTRPGGSVRYWVSNGIWVNDAANVRIDHNYFTSFGAAAIETSMGNNNNLLVDHNWIVDNYLEGYGYGVNVGKSKIFIENNYFEDNRHDVAANSNGHYVARYNYVYNSKDTCTVGTGSPFPRNFDAHRGTGKVEIYNNHVKHALNSGQAVLMRGVYNGAMIYDNTFETMSKGIRFAYYDYEGGDVAGDKYWVWDNTYKDVTNKVSIESSGFSIYYNRPSGYTPDSYPHPSNDDQSQPGLNGKFTGSTRLKGDLDNNGQQGDAVDINMMIQCSVGDYPGDNYFDLDGNGVICDAVDLNMMLQGKFDS